MDAQVVRTLNPFTCKRIATLIAAGTLISLVACIWGERISRHLLPLYQWGFQQVAPYYQIQSLQIERGKGEPKYNVQVQTSGLRYMGSEGQ